MIQTINPVYSTLVAHKDPTKCPLGALAFYFHWLYDEYGLTEKMDIDWSVNKSWRGVSNYPASSASPESAGII
jgi:hypothetical protein